MRPIPKITGIDVAFGNIKHLPAWDDIPKEFRDVRGVHEEFISKWFFKGIGEQDLARLYPKEGVDKRSAIAAIRAILVSFEPKHEHKTAGCAYLLSEWFTLK